MMQSISSHIQTRTALPNPSNEIGFVNSVSEPVYRMLSIGNTMPLSGMADVMIGQYGGVIAADYGHTFLEQNLRVGIGAVRKSFKLSKEQEGNMRELRAAAQTLLSGLMTEKMAMYAKVQSFATIAGQLEAMERQLRAANPQHVQDMLGFAAAALTK
jgi:conjugative transfer pilus assembly protein TraH